MDPEWFLQDFYDGMFSIGIAEAGLNCFKGSLHDFDCFIHNFLGQQAFKGFHSNLVQGTVCTKPALCQEPKFSDPESGHATHEMKETVARLFLAAAC